MPKKRKAEANGLDEMDRQLYGTFRTAANSTSLARSLRPLTPQQRHQVHLVSLPASRASRLIFCFLHSEQRLQIRLAASLRTAALPTSGAGQPTLESGGRRKAAAPEPWAGAPDTDAVGLSRTRRRHEDRYPELVDGARGRLVVLGCEVGGR